MNFKQWIKRTAVNFEEYDLQKKYDHYNIMLFRGELPKIPISYANLKDMD